MITLTTEKNATSKITSCLLLLVFTLLSIPAYAAGTFSLDLDGALRSNELNLAVGQSKVITSTMHIKEIVIGDSSIADVKLLNSMRVLVVGQKTGQTNLVLRDRNKNLIALLEVAVGYDIEAIKFKMHQLLPHEQAIEVRSVNGMVIVSGKVDNALAMDTALVVARSFAKDDVTNLLRVDGNGQQVMLEVRIAEISRGSLKELGVSGSLNGTLGRTALSSATGLTAGAPGATGVATAVANGVVVPNAFGAIGIIYRGLNLTLSALENQGLAKTLAEPNLVALSGTEGSFLVGGEFPIVTVSTNGTPTTEYKSFGVGLSFTPTVLGSNQINLKLQVEASAIDLTNVVGNNYPTLKTRRANTTVEVADGQSFAIAGLIQSDVNNAIDKVPGLGDLPVLGALFRSTNFQRQETELVLVVTPRLVKPMPAGPVALPTDNFVPPNDVDQYLNGRLQGAPEQTSTPSRPTSGTSPGGVDGAFGHQL